MLTVRKLLTEISSLGLSRIQTLRQKHVTPGLALWFSSKLQASASYTLPHFSLVFTGASYFPNTCLSLVTILWDHLESGTMAMKAKRTVYYELNGHPYSVRTAHQGNLSGKIVSKQKVCLNQLPV